MCACVSFVSVSCQSDLRTHVSSMMAGGEKEEATGTTKNKRPPQTPSDPFRGHPNPFFSINLHTTRVFFSSQSSSKSQGSVKSAD